MKRRLKQTAIVIAVLGALAFLAFLYFIPPFAFMQPEQFSRPQNAAAPPVADITDPAVRAIAQHGRYLVMTHGCIGCHQVPSPDGPDLSRYLAGGMKFVNAHGTFATRNLTPDPVTGLARRTDDEVLRVLRSGVFSDGHVTSYRLMPWGAFTNLTEEDRYAILVYLRHLKPVPHAIPDPNPAAPLKLQGAVEAAYAGQDYGHTP
jgi:hypothetical protein